MPVSQVGYEDSDTYENSQIHFFIFKKWKLWFALLQKIYPRLDLITATLLLASINFYACTLETQPPRDLIAIDPPHDSAWCPLLPVCANLDLPATPPCTVTASRAMALCWELPKWGTEYRYEFPRPGHPDCHYELAGNTGGDDPPCVLWLDSLGIGTFHVHLTACGNGGFFVLKVIP